MTAILLGLAALTAVAWLADRLVKRALDRAEARGVQDAIEEGAYTVWFENEGESHGS